MDITQLLAFSVKNKASDLHLSSGLPPMIRVHGDVRRINVEALDHKSVHAMVYDIMNDAQRKHYEDTLECDFSFEIQGLARFRVNAFNQNRGAGAVFRTIPSKILTLEQLGAPKVFAELSLKPRGLVLVTGPTGSGKSTTLAGMVNHLNENEYGHVLTIEDPIEFVHESKKCLINQREVGPHTLSFSNALRSALREDPDVVLIGEMRDLETIESALRIARMLGDPSKEGAILGDLGRFQARYGRLEDAQGSLAAGEALLRSVSDRFYLGMLLCAKAEMLHLAGDQARASASLDEARGIAAEVAGGRAASALGTEITRLTSLLGARHA